MKNQKLFKNFVNEPLVGFQTYPPSYEKNFSSLSEFYKVSYEIIFSDNANSIREKRSIEFRSKRGINTSNEWIKENILTAESHCIMIETHNDISISHIERKIFEYVDSLYSKLFEIKNPINCIYIRDLLRYSSTDIDRLKDPFYFAFRPVIRDKEDLKSRVDKEYFIITDTRNRSIRPLTYDDESIIGDTSRYIISKKYLDKGHGWDESLTGIPLKIE